MIRRALTLLILTLALALRASAADLRDPTAPSSDPAILAGLAQQASERHDYASAATLIRQAIAGRDRPEYRYNLACYLALAGERDEALTELGASIDGGFLDADHISKDTDLASLHEDARFQQQVDRARRLNQERQTKLAAVPPPKEVFVMPVTDRTDQRFPLVVALHGVGGNPEKFSEPLRDWAKKNGIALLAIGGSRALSERGDAFAWTVPGDIQRVHRIIADVVAHEPIDPARVYLLGFSQGGVMSYPIAFHDPSRFAGIISMSGTLQPETVAADRVAAAAGKLPVVIIHGEQDQTVAFALGKATEDRLRSLHFDVMMSTFAGAHRFPPDWEQVLLRSIAWIDEHRHAAK